LPQAFKGSVARISESEEDKVVMDKSGANYAGLANINLLLILAGFATMIDICQVKAIPNTQIKIKIRLKTLIRVAGFCRKH
jgi:hypothetical protein